MTPQEFKAWFDGFTEAFTGCPTKAQWGRIKERVSEIDGKPVTERIYVDRHWPSYIPYNGYPYRAWGASGVVGGLASNQGQLHQQYAQAASCNAVASNKIGSGGASFNSMQAMSDLGRADAQGAA